MVSLWPFKSDDQSTANFEKTLSALSTKISKASAKQSSLRNSLRRSKALWTLYSSFVYILFALIVTLVTGRSNWGTVEYGGLVGGPLLIYGLRYALSRGFDYLLSRNQAYLSGLQKQRQHVIDKFKDATKYNTTQQLLEKYGAEPKTQSTAEDTSQSDNQAIKGGSGVSDVGLQQRRTNMPPPPTANIQRPRGKDLQDHPSIHSNSKDQMHQQSPTAAVTPLPAQLSVASPGPQEEFAPNAELAPPQYAAGTSTQPQWYDRIMDLLLGEDESRPSNRLVLICDHCKLVNGQAPPGVKQLEDLGRWKCFSCREWNGSENEVQRIIQETVKSSATTIPSEA